MKSRKHVKMLTSNAERPGELSVERHLGTVKLNQTDGKESARSRYTRREKGEKGTPATPSSCKDVAAIRSPGTSLQGVGNNLGAEAILSADATHQIQGTRPRQISWRNTDACVLWGVWDRLSA